MRQDNSSPIQCLLTTVSVLQIKPEQPVGNPDLFLLKTSLQLKNTERQKKSLLTNQLESN